MKSTFTVFSVLTAVCLPVAAFAAASAPADPVNWMALFFALTTFYSEGLAAIPAIRANAIYQQIGQLLSFIAMFLRSR